jgi:hypothetical protein
MRPGLWADASAVSNRHVAAVWYWAVRSLRGRWRSLVFLTVLAAFAGGATLAAVAGARRNETAYDRLRAQSLPADVMALPNQPGFDWDAVRALPEVEALGTFAVAAYSVDGADDPGFFPTTSPELFRSVEAGVLFAGRRYDPTRADEVVVTPSARRNYGLDVGDHVTVRPGEGERNGSSQRATVVGVLRIPFGVAFGPDSGAVIPTPAFFEKFEDAIMRGGAGYENALIRLRQGSSDLPALQRHIDEVAGRPVDLTDIAAQGKRVTNSTSLESDALYAFALAAAIASLVLVGQAIARNATLAEDEREVLRAFGVTRASRALAAAAGCILVCVPIAAGGAAFAWLLSNRFPIGVGRSAEPSPGRRFDAAVLLPGAVVIALLVAGGAFVVAVMAQRGPREGRRRRSAIASAARTAGAPLPIALGTRLALESGRGRTAIPVRPALAGAVAAVLGVVGAFTFRSGIDDADLASFGQRYDTATGAVANEPLPAEPIDALKRDSTVTLITDTPTGIVDVQGHGVALFPTSSLKGSYDIATLHGREPRGPTEIMLAPQESDALHASVGDEIEIAGSRFTVVGIGLTPAAIHTEYDQGAWLTRQAFDRLLPPERWKFHLVYVGFADGTDVDAAIKRINDSMDIGLEATTPPTDLQNLQRVRTVPLALGAFLVVLAVGAVGYALVAAVTRRRHDIAILRSIGMTRVQSRLCVVAQATTVAAVGILIGIPLGIAAGRLLWRWVADSFPFLYHAPLALLALVLVPLLALAISNVLAALAGTRAARLRPADVLRTE